MPVKPLGIRDPCTMAVLSIIHQYRTGWHTYTSPQMPGLFLTGPDEDAQALLDALPSTICALIHAAEQRSASIHRTQSYRGSTDQVRNADVKEIMHFLVAFTEPGVPRKRADLPKRRTNGK